jgi:hypothetical protein
VLAEHWKLPDVLRIPMMSHHSPRDIEDGSLRKVSEVIAQAGRCADVFVTDDPAGVIASARKGFFVLYKLEEEAADALLCEIGGKTAELAPLFDLEVNAAGSYESILEKASEQLFEISLSEKAGSPGVPPLPDDNGQAKGTASKPKKPAAAATGSEKRRSQRMKRDGMLTVITCSRGILGMPIECRLKDISVTGLGLVAPVRMEPMSQFIIQLPQPDGGIKSLLYEVVRCETSGGLTSIGSQLMAVLRPERHTSKRPLAEIGG